MRRLLWATLLIGGALAACGSSRSTFDENTDGGSGYGGGADAGPSPPAPPAFGDGSTSVDGSNADGCAPNLTGVIRDFMSSHPDFEKALGDDRGLVQQNLGVDGKPVYAPAGATATVSGQASFDQWYRDVAGVNQKMLYTLPLTKGPNGISTFDSNAFFPIDNMLFGNETNPHNYHFTFELHTEFVYRGGEVFTFVGDDDVFTFINGKLAIDLGGIHGGETASVDLDAQSTALGIAKGGKYPMDIFQAERHTTESNFRVDTTIEFTNCAPILK